MSEEIIPLEQEFPDTADVAVYSAADIASAGRLPRLGIPTRLRAGNVFLDRRVAHT